MGDEVKKPAVAEARCACGEKTANEAEFKEIVHQKGAKSKKYVQCATPKCYNLVEELAAKDLA